MIIKEIRRKLEQTTERLPRGTKDQKRLRRKYELKRVLNRMRNDWE